MKLIETEDIEYVQHRNYGTGKPESQADIIKSAISFMLPEVAERNLGEVFEHVSNYDLYD
jgi:hypothetical protein